MSHEHPTPPPTDTRAQATTGVRELLDKIELGLQIGAEADEICNAQLERHPGHIDSDIRAAIKAAKQLRKLLTPPATATPGDVGGDVDDEEGD